MQSHIVPGAQVNRQNVYHLTTAGCESEMLPSVVDSKLVA